MAALKNRITGPAFYLFRKTLKDIARLKFNDLGGIAYYLGGSSRYYDYLLTKYYSKEESCFIFGNIKLPLIYDKTLFVYEFLNLIYPVICNAPDFPYSEDPYENEFVKLESGDIVFDCGANIGMFSAYASSIGCKVYAFEPFPKALEYLNITANKNPNITVCELALMDKEADFKIMFTPNNIDMGSIVINRDKEEEILVKGTTIDDFVKKNNINKINFIKADIEGAERNMLLGAKTVLKEFAPKLSICKYHLPDDPIVIKEIILDANPRYIIKECNKKIFARCD
ncbi:MAG: FkbM family methyltransferase [Thermodesulfovibrionales bacterium]|nr:FkbM family methyltransferase [Thermodesulfovibrionales bacterium]